MAKNYLGIFIISMTTLMMELALTRVFDVILQPNLAYMVVSCALLSFGLAGIYVVLRPIPENRDVRTFLASCSLLFALSALLIRPLLNILPFDYTELPDAPLVQLLSFTGMYLVIAVPFFFSGLIFTTLFSHYSRKIQLLYFWDLVGAGIGCVILIPFLPPIGPGGLFFLACGLGLFASCLFTRNAFWSIAALIGGVVVIALPFEKSPDYFTFTEHVDKRGVKEGRNTGNIEYTRWDPISKIDVANDFYENGIKHVAYDGGNQSSRFYPFDGDLVGLRTRIENGLQPVEDHFWFGDVLASHYLKRDQDQQVLIIGSAGGQETNAALMYGAAHVDAVELVGTVVDLAKGPYSDFIGKTFEHPNVFVRKGEGRSFLRASTDRYDIIQIFSNHTSSSIASGTGSMRTDYLQTAEAYREYFKHLKQDGLLHINHHVYPRMITTAALAWKQMGRSDFQKHVLVFQRTDDYDNLPTLLINMQPWTAKQIEELKRIVLLSKYQKTLVEDPLHPQDSFLTPVFYSGDFPTDLANQIEYRVAPTTDDQPYFNHLRKKLGKIEDNPELFLTSSTAWVLNKQLKRSIPMDIIHLVVTGVVSLLFVVLFIFLPLSFSKTGRVAWPRKYHSLVYFSCLGAGFIMIELVLIYIFLKLIGFPLYAFSTVIFTLLLAAGIGSLSSSRLELSDGVRWILPFIGVGATGLALLFSYPFIFEVFLASHISVRILVSILLLFPIGFFLGMPFPLGILCIDNGPKGAVAWAWAMNGLFTVIGGLASVLLSIYIGFQATFLIGLSIYLVAFAMFYMMKTSVQEAT